jgi:hypothetical protein
MLNMDESRRNEESRRPARKRRKWQYYIPTAIMLALALVCVVTITFAVTSVLKSYAPGGNDPTGNIIGSDPLNPSTPTDSSSPSTKPTGITINTRPTDKPTEPSAPSQPTEEKDVVQLIAEADFIAAGYDYDKAISMLKSSPYFETNTTLKDKVAEYTTKKSKLQVYSKPSTVTHIFFHSLIVDTDRAFDGDEDQDGYNMYMTTVAEFKAILQAMYDRGYVLISPYDLAYEVTNADGTTKFVYGEIKLPAGKTPFIMSQDDVNYYSYMIGSGNGKNETPVFNDAKNDGFASRIVIDPETGFPVCEYTDANGVTHYGDYDLVPVLETFIQEHPDFSYRGARAILGMTGYEGVFGYRTKPGYEAELNKMHAAGKYPYTYAEEVQMAKDVAQCLRDHGWILASHSYGHPAYGNISADRVATDSDKWEDTVESIIGETDVILFPHGSDIHNWRNYTFDNEKFASLYEDGFRYFFNVDSNTYWNQLGANYFRGGRRNLDGFRMYHNPERLEDLFDAKDVFDKARPLPVPSIGGGM